MADGNKIEKEKIKNMLSSLINEEEFNVNSVSEAISRAVSFINEKSGLDFFDNENILNNREIIFDIIQNKMFEEKTGDICDLIKSGDLNLFEPLLKNDFIDNENGSSMEAIISSPIYLSITSGNEAIFNACIEYAKKNNININDFDLSSYIHFDLIDDSNMLKNKKDKDSFLNSTIPSIKNILNNVSSKTEESISKTSKMKKRKVESSHIHKKTYFDGSQLLNSEIIFKDNDFNDPVIYYEGEENKNEDDGVHSNNNSSFIIDDNISSNKASDFYHVKIPLILYAVIFEKNNNVTKKLLSFYDKIDKETAMEILLMKQSFDFTKISSGNFQKLILASVSSSSYRCDDTIDFSFQENPNIEFSRMLSFNEKNKNLIDNEIVDIVLDKMELFDRKSSNKINGLIMTPLMGDLLVDVDLRKKIIEKAKKENAKINLTSIYENLSLIKKDYNHQNNQGDYMWETNTRESKFRINWEDEKTALHDIVDIIDVNEKGVYGETILHWAAHCGDCELIKKLLYLGADPSALNYDNLTPLEVLEKNLDKDIFVELSFGTENKDDIVGVKKRVKSKNIQKKEVLEKAKDILIIYSSTQIDKNQNKNMMKI